MLNSTLTATERTICCILENYQEEDGVNVPEVLQPYMSNKKFIPFKAKPVPVDAKVNKKSKAKVSFPLHPSLSILKRKFHGSSLVSLSLSSLSLLYLSSR